MRRARESRPPSTSWFVRRLLAYEPLRYLFAAVCWLLYHLWPLFPGLIGLAFFDDLQKPSRAGLNVPTVVGLAAAAGLARVGIIFFANVSSAGWRFRVRSLVQHNMFARLFERPGADALPTSIGEAVSTIGEDAKVMSLMGDWVFDFVSAVTFAIVGFAILFWVDATVTLLVVLPLIIVIAATHLARVRMEHLRQRSRAAAAAVTSTINELVGIAPTIQAAGAEERVVAHLRRQGEIRKQAVLRDELQGLSLDAVFASTATVGMGLTLLVAASAMLSGRFTVGDFVLFSTYLLQMAQFTSFIGYLIRTFRQSSVSFTRGIQLLEGAAPRSLVRHRPLYVDRAGPALEEPPAPAPFESLVARHVTLRYPGSDRGVEDVSLSLRRGTVTVIVGRIGSGKTTLLRCLTGLLEPQSGEVLWNGERVAAPAEFLVPRKVAYTPQNAHLLSATVRENILLGLPDDERLEGAVHDAALGLDVADLPDGLNTEIGVRGVRLSGGQQQRTAAARMFVRRSDLLVFDDLTSALDGQTEQAFWTRLFQSRRTCLIVSHQPSVLERADNIVVLRDGQVIDQGRLPDLLARCPEMARLCRDRAVTGPNGQAVPAEI
ncbi:MAG TPA: ABC transporter ATP-binding protein [Streptosporangiaceae bacterium]|jgi:ATP-binding cassette subfamily B protein|nr:ABC transporter ATP-binding protein [Streptosporangiaceae bacterium]